MAGQEQRGMKGGLLRLDNVVGRAIPTPVSTEILVINGSVDLEPFVVLRGRLDRNNYEITQQVVDFSTPVECISQSRALHFNRCGTGLLRTPLVPLVKCYRIALLPEIGRKMIHRIATGKTKIESINGSENTSLAQRRKTFAAFGLKLFSLIKHLPTLFSDG